MKKLIAIATVMALMSLSGPVFAKWEAKTRTDPINDKVTRSASEVSSKGHLVSVDRDDDGRVWMSILIPDSNPDMFDPDRGVDVRVDSNEASSHEKTKGMEKYGIPVDFYWFPKFVRFLIWHGDDSEGRSAFIKELMTGKSLTVRFFTPMSGARDFKVNLSGAGGAIANALGIPEKQSASNALLTSINQRANETSSKCSTSSPALLTACFAKINKCRTESKNLGALELCLKPIDAELSTEPVAIK